MRVRGKEGVLAINHNKWFYVPKPNPKAKARLFCFHYAGGTAEMYHKWAEEIPEEIELCSIQLPGRSKRINETPYKDIETLIDELHNAIKPYLDVPFAYFGHSMGAMILFDYTQYLFKRNLTLPFYLLIAARKAPNIQSFHPHLHNLTDDEMIGFVRGLDIRPDAFFDNQDLLKKSIPMIKSDFEIVEKWKFDTDTVPLSIPIWVFGGESDEYVSKNELESWKNFTKVDFKAQHFVGDHFFILDDSHRKTILKIITESIFNRFKK